MEGLPMTVLQLFAMCLNAGITECPMYYKLHHYYEAEIVAPMCITIPNEYGKVEELAHSLSTQYVHNDGKIYNIKIEAIPKWKCQQV